MLYIQILERLSKEGIGFECEIIDLFEMKDPLKDKLGAVGLVETMQEDKHITYDFFPKDISDSPITSMIASITFLGMDYLMKHNLAVKTQRSLKTQTWIGIIAQVLLAISIFVSARLILTDQATSLALSKYKTQLDIQEVKLNKLETTFSSFEKHSKQSNSDTLKEKP